MYIFYEKDMQDIQCAGFFCRSILFRILSGASAGPFLPSRELPEQPFRENAEITHHGFRRDTEHDHQHGDLLGNGRDGKEPAQIEQAENQPRQHGAPYDPVQLCHGLHDPVHDHETDQGHEQRTGRGKALVIDIEFHCEQRQGQYVFCIFRFRDHSSDP